MKKYQVSVNLLRCIIFVVDILNFLIYSQVIIRRFYPTGHAPQCAYVLVTTIKEILPIQK